MPTDGCTIPISPDTTPARQAGRLPRLTGSEWALLLVLATVQFTHVLDFVIMMPLGPKLQGDLHISPEEFPDKFSSIVSAYGFSAGIMGLLAARLLDRFDRKKSLLVLFLGFAAGTLLCAVAPNYVVLLVGRAVAGGFAGVMGANVLTIVSDVFPESRRATAMGVVMSSFSVASIVGIYVGLEIAEHFGWRAPFTILALLCLPVLLLAWYVLPPLRRHLVRRPARGVGLAEVILNPRHLRAYALSSSLIMGSWMIIPTLAIYLVKNLHWPEAELRWVWLVGGVATLLTMTPTGWLSDSRDKLTVFRVIGLLSVIPVLLVTNLPETSMPVILLVTTLFMVVTSIRWVPVMAMITTSAVPHQRGTFMSVNASVQQLAMGLASKISGLLLVEQMVVGADGISAPKLVGYPLVGLLAAASMIAAVFLAGRLRRAPVVAVHGTPEMVAEPVIL
ncbi:MAG TPA: MFS transporter [Gemmataceae bacterium]|jgi:DHA1 family inner membrane transport protein|nr:MFS transporter [Gemmataceae bacterium]